MPTTTPKVKGSAAGQYLGYALQPVRLCYHLLSCKPNGSASMEELDDVAVKEADGQVLLEQTKSALKQNPVSDWADDLWKTFANWAENADAGLVDPTKTQFRLYVTPMKSGKWVQRFHDANYTPDVLDAISEFRKDLQGLRRKPKSHIHISRFLAINTATIAEIIANFALDSNEDPIDPIRKILRIGVQDSLLDHCCAFAIGLAKETADECIRKRLPASIDADQYRTKVKSFVTKNNLLYYLPSFAPSPSEESIEKTLVDRPVFVRQLNIVEMPRDHVVRAVSDLLKSAADKTDWAEKGLISTDSFIEFDKSLIRQHELHELEVKEVYASLDPCARGRVLYGRCASNSTKLQGREVPSHFVPGCYNDLADRLAVGWHPAYKILLEEPGNSHG